MGAYLSEPVTDKVSSDEKCERLCYGVSSMQGWRVTQEDAHNCIPNYDENSSFFAVYDGHGGAEVAKYCSIHLPNFLRSLPQYKENKLMKSLETAFIEFDSLLTKPEVIAELKQLVGVYQLGDASESEEDETEVLNEEAEMPLDELLARYKSGGLPLKVSPRLRHLHNDKPKSPMLRAKKDERLQNPIKTLSRKNMKEKNEKNDEIMVNGENESKCEDESQSDANIKEKMQKLNEKSDDSLGKGDNLEKQQVSGVNFISDCGKGKGDAGTNGDASDTDKEKSNELDDDKVDISLDKESASTSSTRKRKGGPLLDLEDSDTSDDDYGESGSSEEFNEEWNKLDDDEEDDEDDDDEEEEEEEDDDDDDKEEDEEDKKHSRHDLFSMGEKEEPGSDSGCTAVVALLHGNKLYVANAGDSRCVVSREGKALDMSWDHKPEDRKERARIEDAGGKVTGDGRVNGGLNLSRAIGDHSYKQNANLPPEGQMITALPDVRTLTLGDSDDFMVLACDGIWNYMSSQEVIDFVRKRLGSTEKLSTICEELFDNCLSPNTLGDGTGCDNMTCIIVKFLNLGSPDSGAPVTKRSHSPEKSSPDVGKNKKLNVESS